MCILRERKFCTETWHRKTLLSTLPEKDSMEFELTVRKLNCSNASCLTSQVSKFLRCFGTWRLFFEIFLKYVWNIVEILRDYFLNRSKFLRISNSRKGPTKTWWYRCNVWNCNNTETFFTDSCVCHGWRCGLQLCIEIIFAFLLGTPRKTIFRQWGGELPNGMGSPVTARTIGEYLQQMRHKVAQHGFRQMINTRLTGHVQIDETFVATKRKHNRGRVKRNRKFTLVRH